MNQTQQASAIESETGESQYSVMYVVCKNQYQHIKHFVWLSTPVPVAVTAQMTDWHGNVCEVVPDKPGSASWRSMSGSLQMLLGTGPSRRLEGATTHRRSSGPLNE